MGSNPREENGKSKSNLHFLIDNHIIGTKVPLRNRRTLSCTSTLVLNGICRSVNSPKVLCFIQNILIILEQVFVDMIFHVDKVSVSEHSGAFFGRQDTVLFTWDVFYFVTWLVHLTQRNGKK